MRGREKGSQERRRVCEMNKCMKKIALIIIMMKGSEVNMS